jgi:hypothetical protein
MTESRLFSHIKLFKYYKTLGEKAIMQLSDEQLFLKDSLEKNSIGNLVKHLWGNMLSRWTDFLSSDGEKSWRERDAEFEDTITTRDELMEKWEEGWQVLFTTLGQLSVSDLSRTISIRGEVHKVEEAILRQTAHYAYHIGQIVYIAKEACGENWQTLSIARGQSQRYNQTHAGNIKESGESI